MKTQKSEAPRGKTTGHQKEQDELLRHDSEIAILTEYSAKIGRNKLYPHGKTVRYYGE